MERLRERFAVAVRAISRLQEAVQLPNPSDLERDAIKLVKARGQVLR